MLNTGLPVSRYVPVSVSLTSPVLVAQSINTLLVITSDTVIDAGERMRTYEGLSAVARSFGTDSEAYRAADIWFSQDPRPHNIMIGRWIKEPSPASLVGGILTAADQNMDLWRAVTAGSFTIPVGGTPQTVSGLDFSAQGNLNGVATIINGALTGAEIRWTGERFIVNSTTTGVTATLGFMTPVTPATGMDISAMLRGQQGSGGGRVVDGHAPETALAAALEIDGLYSSQFYAVVVPEGDDDDQLQLAAWCEGADPVHCLGVTTQDTNSLDLESEDDIGAQLHGFGYMKTVVMYSTYSKYAVCGYLARILTTDWTGSNTALTMKYKRAPGVHIEALSSYQADTLAEKAINVYTGVANGANIIQEGVQASGDWSDLIIGADALALGVQNALFAAMYQTATKIPQTDIGMTILRNRASAACSRFVTNGYLAPGVWFAPGFGGLDYAGQLQTGYYVWSPSVGEQPEEDRVTRAAPLIQIACKTAGAFHKVDVSIFVNQ